MLRLVTSEPKADELIPLAKNKLTERQYDIWFATEIEGLTQYAIHRQYGYSVRTIQREIARASEILVLAWEEAQEGEIHLGQYVEQGGCSKYKEDLTALKAHDHLIGTLGQAVRAYFDPACARAA